MKLEVKNLIKSFAGTEVLHGISFEVEGGRALGLLGRNGAGKTTTMRILMDVFKADSGEIYLDGKTFKPSHEKIGYLPEERGLYPKRTVIDQMIYLARLRGFSTSQAKSNAKKWLTRLGVYEYEARKLETLSKGNQQKVQLAATLVCDPEIVILDEPFSGLDPVNSQILKEVVGELIDESKLVIFSSHQMSYVEQFCDNIAIIDQGEVVLQGDLKEIKKSYGKDRLILSAENYPLNELNDKLKTDGKYPVKIHGKTKDYLILNIEETVTKNDFLTQLIHSDIWIEYFGNYEPSLNDIFVEKVGEEDEEA